MRNLDEQHMAAALALAGEALEEGEFPVGCVLVYDNEIVAGGRRRNSRGGGANELDHGEIVALRRLFAEHPEIDRGRITVYSTMEPCLMCFASLLLNGIRTFVYAYEDAMGGGTDLQLAGLAPLYREMTAGVRIVPYVLRGQSLELFKKFFRNQENDYWQGSMLAEYTLKQG